MVKGQLEKLIIQLDPSYSESEEIKKIQEASLLNYVTREVQYAMGQCKKIERESQNTVDVIALTMRGKERIEIIEVDYTHHGEEKNKTMPLDEFYQFLPS